MQARQRALDIVYNDILPISGPNDINQYKEFQDFKKAENPAYTEAELKEMAEDYVHSILFAGHESATTTLTFAIKYLSENPQILAEVKVSIFLCSMDPLDPVFMTSLNFHNSFMSLILP